MSRAPMRVAVDTVELPVSASDGLLAAVDRAVAERSPLLPGVRDLRLRFRNVKGALLCIAAVGLSGGGLATSTASSANPIDAVVGALDGLPDRIGRVSRNEARTAGSSKHAAVRAELKKLLDRA